MDLSGLPPLSAHAFRSVRFEADDPGRPGGRVKADWTDKGWTFLGLPRAGSAPASVPARFAGLARRLESAVARQSETERLIRAVASAQVPLPAGDPQMGLLHFAEAVGEIIRAERPKGGMASTEAVDFVKSAWQSALMGLAGRSGASAAAPEWTLDASGIAQINGRRLPTLSFIGGPSAPEMEGMPSLPTFSEGRATGSGEDSPSGDSGDAATPGNPGRQRLAPSARPSDKTPCSGQISNIKGDVKVNGQAPQNWTIMDLNGAVITTGGGKSRIQIDLAGGLTIRLGAGSRFDMTETCAQGAGGEPGGKAGLGGGAAYVTSPGGDFQITTSNDANGVRGSMNMGRRLPDRVLLASLSGPTQAALLETEFEGIRAEPRSEEDEIAQAKTAFDANGVRVSTDTGRRLPDRVSLASLSGPAQAALLETELQGVWTELRPEEDEIAKAKTAFLVAYRDGGYFFVKVDKGPVTVILRGQPVKSLLSGEKFFLELKSSDSDWGFKVTAGPVR